MLPPATHTATCPFIAGREPLFASFLAGSLVNIPFNLPLLSGMMPTAKPDYESQLTDPSAKLLGAPLKSGQLRLRYQSSVW